MNEYPPWKKSACVHCAAGIPISVVSREHWTSDHEPRPCTAPTEADYIAELEDKIKMIEARGGGDWLDNLEAELADARKLADERRHYLSTACYHGQHNACRLQCKFCTQTCRCVCHGHRKTDTIKPTYQELEKLVGERGAALAVVNSEAAHRLYLALIPVLTRHLNLDPCPATKLASQIEAQISKTVFADGYEHATAWLQAHDAEVPALLDYYERQVEWSSRTFGHGTRTKGIIQHISKELHEIESQPHDLSEWIDVVMLAMDGYWRHGGDPKNFMADLLAKQRKNFARTWPNPTSEDEAIEHDRDAEIPALKEGR